MSTTKVVKYISLTDLHTIWSKLTDDFRDEIIGLSREAQAYRDSGQFSMSLHKSNELLTLGKVYKKFLLPFKYTLEAWDEQ